MPMANDLQHIPFDGIDERDCLEYDMDNLFESYKYTEHSRCHFEEDVDPENNYYNNTRITQNNILTVT